jgi:hypothetical protein
MFYETNEEYEALEVEQLQAYHEEQDIEFDNTNN